MSLITFNGLVDLVDRGVITPVPKEHINAASIDVTMGRWVWTEDRRGRPVNLKEKETPGMVKYDLLHRSYELAPGEFVLAQTQEVFNLPNDVSAEFRLKSSSARAGLDQALAVWCDAGWNRSVLTMELRNNLQHHSLILSYGMKVGQMIFWKGEPVPESQSYATRGQYNGDQEAQPSKGVR